MRKFLIVSWSFIAITLIAYLIRTKVETENPIPNISNLNRTSPKTQAATKVLPIFLEELEADNTIDQIPFFAIGDWGVKGTKAQPAVAKAMSDFQQTHPAKFIIALGDNFYPIGAASTADEHFKKSFEDVYASAELLPLNWFVALGNHDYYGSPEAEIDYSKINPRWHMPARYFIKQFNGGNVTADFFFIDTSPYIESYYSDSKMKDELLRYPNIRSEQIEWLKSNLQSSKADWQIVVGHHPLYSGSLYHLADQPAMQASLEHIFKENGVDIYFAGHDHDLQLSKPPYNMYQVVSGGGQETRPVANHQYQIFAKSITGFSNIVLTKTNFKIQFISGQGEILFSKRYNKEAIK
jgi:tartrate-resistant acid phosphatase type 5